MGTAPLGKLHPPSTAHPRDGPVPDDLSSGRRLTLGCTMWDATSARGAAGSGLERSSGSLNSGVRRVRSHVKSKVWGARSRVVFSPALIGGLYSYTLCSGT